MAENANFSVKTLLTRANVTRAQFRRHFSGKAELLTVLAGEGVKGLSEILEAAQPAVQTATQAAAQPLRVAVGAGASMSSPSVPAPPAADAWLERRLRVFERALQSLEKRQETSEQALTRAIALLQEKLDAPVAAPEVIAPTPEPQTETPVMVAPTVMAEEETASSDAPALALEPMPAPEPISEKEIQDFLAHARQAARNAAFVEPAPPKARNTPVLAWGGAGLLLLLLLGMGLLLADRALGRAAPVTAGGVIHRQVAQSGMPRVMALADNGDAGAQTALAVAYLKGAGVPNDAAAAMRWSLAAAGQGQPVAEYLLGTLYLETGNQDEAVRWFKSAADQGNVKAMHNLAIAYAQGTGMAKDPAQAVTWFVRAAGQGYRDSQFDLGVLYERGEGVPQDATIALKWYLIAASQGDAPSAERAQFLKTQLDASDVKAATDAAASFAPSPSQAYANEIGASALKG